MTGNREFERFIERALELGAIEAKIIDPASIVIEPWVRLKCEYGCPYYDTRHCCPPHTPTPEQFRQIVACYDKALLFHSQGMDVSPTEIAVALELEIFFEGYYKAFGLGAGPCWKCKKCVPDKCVHPLEARPAMEGCGIDVYATARAHGYPIQVVRDRSETPNRYGLILIE